MTHHPESWGDRAADRIVLKIGSMRSVVLHTILFVAFFAAAIFGLWTYSTMLLVLTTVVSLEAIYLCLFMQNSINRSGERDRRQADADYRVNQESKAEIDDLQRAHARVEKMLKDIIE